MAFLQKSLLNIIFLKTCSCLTFLNVSVYTLHATYLIKIILRKKIYAISEEELLNPKKKSSKGIFSEFYKILIQEFKRIYATHF